MLALISLTPSASIASCTIIEISRSFDWFGWRNKVSSLLFLMVERDNVWLLLNFLLLLSQWKIWLKYLLLLPYIWKRSIHDIAHKRWIHFSWAVKNERIIISLHISCRIYILLMTDTALLLESAWKIFTWKLHVIWFKLA